MMPNASSQAALRRAQALLAEARGRSLARNARAELAEALAAELLAMSQNLTAPPERGRAELLDRLTRDPRGQAFTTALTDRLYRSQSSRRAAEQLAYLLTRFGVPRYLRGWERAQLRAGGAIAALLPSLVAAGARARIRQETAGVLLAAEEPALTTHLAKRRAQGVHVNVNQLGEALLGEQAAETRVARYIELARRSDVNALSVKVSSIGSQLHLHAFESTVRTLAERLARIYAATLAHPDDTRPVVMLDMEAYRHVELTLRVMQRALGDRALDRVRAGIVMQAYLPDSNALQRELVAWAAARVARGGAALRVRLVKGANLAHERVEAEKLGYRVPMFATKGEVDANYKRMLEGALCPEALAGIKLGVASHNLFDIAYALVLAHERSVEADMGVEMLEGMADPQGRAVASLGAELLVYAPVCHANELNTAIAYLVRRLDENTSPENFLGASFRMAPFDAAFERERQRFRAAVAAAENIDERPRNAGRPSHERALPPLAPRSAFANEPDTEFACASNRVWLDQALAAEYARPQYLVASVIAGERVAGERRRAGQDPSRRGVVPYEVALAGPQDLERALACAEADPAGFSRTAPEGRAQLLRRVAMALRRHRGELISRMVADGGKRVTEADSEVSEAIDFAEYYRESYLTLLREESVSLTPRGTVLVTPPWNFPLAIPAGGVLAGLMAGNRVILKPAMETAAIAERMVQLFYAAGVPRTALQFVVCEDEVGSALIEDARVCSVILTGATDTARLFQRMRPGLHLLAETGGKNAYIVTAMSDRDQAIADVVQSAFGHAGQKCSAASLLILEAEVHDDPHFMATLKDAVESLPVGSAWDPRHVVTPLIREPEGPLARALSQLDPGERWLVEPRIDPDNPQLVSPGVKLGVTADSFSHLTELFGPVLGVMRATDLSHAIALANATGYGLTAGLASLDEREQARFVEGVRAGNLYVNRTTTGAIVQRQPFGGMGKSGFGPGAKAGGPNYVAQLCHVQPHGRVRWVAPAAAVSTKLAERLEAFASWLARREANTLRDLLQEYAQAWIQHFARVHDPQRLLGQHNAFRYLPCQHLVLRAEPDASFTEVAASCLAASLVGARLTASVSPAFRGPVDGTLYGHPVHVGALQDLTPQPQVKRLRVLGSRSAEHDAFAYAHGVHVADAPLLPLGRFELLHYLEEQSISLDYHRYGHVDAESGSWFPLRRPAYP